MAGPWIGLGVVLEALLAAVDVGLGDVAINHGWNTDDGVDIRACIVNIIQACGLTI